MENQVRQSTDDQAPQTVVTERSAYEAPRVTVMDEADVLKTLGASGGLRYQPDAVQPGAVALQQFLNRVPGVFLREDGKLGQRSSDAYKAVFGHYLAGDPRGV